MDSLGKSAALSIALQGKAASDAKKATETLSSLVSTAKKPDELRQVAEQFEITFEQSLVARQLVAQYFVGSSNSDGIASNHRH